MNDPAREGAREAGRETGRETGNAGDETADRRLDGNALGGRLASIFGADMTAVPGRCAHCHTVSMVGQLLAYVDAPGAVLRCPACDQVVLRVVLTDDAVLLDARGAAYLRFERHERGG